MHPRRWSATALSNGCESCGSGASMTVDTLGLGDVGGLSAAGWTGDDGEHLPPPGGSRRRGMAGSVSAACAFCAVAAAVRRPEVAGADRIVC